PTRQNLWRLTYFYRYIRPQARQHVSVLKPDGSARTVDVDSRIRDKPVTELGDLIAEVEETIERSRDVGVALGSDVFVWRMPVFGNPDHVDEMLRKARGYRTLILDLRGNGGGLGDALKELVSRTFDREIVVADEKFRDREVRAIAK